VVAAHVGRPLVDQLLGVQAVLGVAIQLVELLPFFDLRLGGKLNRKPENASVAKFRHGHGRKVHFSAKLLSDLLRDNQAESNAVAVVARCALDKAEEFEQFILVRVWNPYTSINDGYLEELPWLLAYRAGVLLDYFSFDSHAPRLGKFEGVGLQVQNHLHDALLVGVDEWTELLRARHALLD